MEGAKSLRKRHYKEKVYIFFRKTQEQMKSIVKKIAFEGKTDEKVQGSNFLNLMEEDEVNEKHFQDAIKSNGNIPVPEIVEIDEEIYDKFYPNNYQMPEKLVKTGLCDDPIEYDIDSEDEEWLEKYNSENPELSVDNFESLMEFLENYCGNKSIPKINDLQNFFKKHPAKMIQEVYDYWLEKRLKKNGKKLIHEVLIETQTHVPNKKSKIVKINPYVAFRPRDGEKMSLRKDRARNYENYRQMLQLKTNLKKHHDKCLDIVNKEKIKHELLTAKRDLFIDQYKNKEFSSHSYQLQDTSLNFFVQEYQYRRRCEYNQEDICSENPSCEIEEPFPFIRNIENQYHRVKKNNETTRGVQNPIQNFHRSTSGRIRQRVGRGGRTIIDRILNQSVVRVYTTSPEFRHIPIFSNIEKLNRCTENTNIVSSQNNVGSSFFHLHQQKYIDFDINDYEWDIK
ncbi:hypothetical protein PVAND_009185 [Polypedilum vanderplanki]|uniref:Enhancer of polycomb-like protein n=1 Tax=Polypedilum vanderplanki TaxID=319348 RepID=A0A9J6CBV1_POLVA|nr:hypothetical protein PVAND_009185 [Polypedilum vanderplanki]